MTRRAGVGTQSKQGLEEARQHVPIPEFLQHLTWDYHKEMQILSLELIQSIQFCFKFIDLSNAASPVAGKESPTIRFYNAETIPEALDGRFELFQLIFSASFLLKEPISSIFEPSDVLILFEVSISNIWYRLNDRRCGLSKPSRSNVVITPKAQRNTYLFMQAQLFRSISIIFNDRGVSLYK